MSTVFSTSIFTFLTVVTGVTGITSELKEGASLRGVKRSEVTRCYTCYIASTKEPSFMPLHPSSVARFPKSTCYRFPKSHWGLAANPTETSHDASQAFGVVVVLSLLWKEQHVRQQMIGRNSPFRIAVGIGPLRE